MKRRACARISPDHRGPLSHANGCSRIHNLSSKHGNASKKLVQTSLLSFFGKREASSFNVVEEVVGGKSVEVICLEDSARKPLLVPVEWEKQIVTHSEFKVENNSKITTKNTRGPMNNKRTKWRKPDLPARKVYHSRMMSTTYLPCIQKYLPEFKKIQDSTFTVDCFSYGAIPGVTHYFLSHFHADHYMGLTKKFNGGTIVCSDITCALVKTILGVSQDLMLVAKVGESLKIGEFVVTFVDANHCPGAVMFLFSNLATKKSQLHTGDFRADKGLQDNFKLLISNPQNLIDVGNLSGVVPSNVVPAAETVPFPLSAIYLDTTYASDNYSFPGQDRVIQQCCMQLTSIFKRDKSIVVPIRRLVLVGSYTIGKEKVGLAIARSLSTTIHCRDSKKRKIFRNCLMWPELEGLLCDDPLQAAVHIVPMGEICPKRISDYLNKLWPHYTHAVGVKPTGWTFETSKSTSIKTKSSRLNAASTFKSGETAMALPQKYSVHSHSRITELGETIRTKDAIIVLPVAYSEHSSFSELASFLDMAIPQASDDCKVIPTVSNSGSFFLRPSDYTKGSDLLRAWQNRYETPQVHGESPLNLTNE